MKFEKAITNTSDTKHAYQKGLGAIPPRDRRRMSCNQTSRLLTGSLNLDNAVQSKYPNDSRWDYGIGMKKNARNDRIIWVEVHPAKSSNVKETIKKLIWLKSWLKKSAPLINQLYGRSFHWIATNGVNISKNSNQARNLAQSGIRFRTEHLNLDQFT